jgi:hypothetical protein
MRKINRTNEREHQGRLKSSLTGTFNTQLQQLRLLKTATKKRRALKNDRIQMPDSRNRARRPSQPAKRLLGLIFD